MGSYAEEQRWLRYYEEHKEDYKYKLVGTKKLFNLPFIFVKQNKKGCKKYDLFNCITLMECYGVGEYINE